jgi:hypothetical protein
VPLPTVPASCVVVASVPLVQVGAVPEANTQPDGRAEVAVFVMPSNDCA